jgi:acyl-CoA reductase-like NAD-dependent aldehyde dehydrogenase
MLIGGELTFGDGGEWIDSVNPSNEEPVGRAPAGTAGDVARAADAALKAQPAWAALTVWERAGYMKAMATAIRARAEEITLIEAADSGNTIANLGPDLFKSANQFEYFAGLATEMKGETIPGLSSGLHMTLREPFGVVGRIVPFNHPFMFATANLAAPLLAGNTIIMKSPETSPLSASITAEICAKVLPPGVVNLVSGYGLPVGDGIARHPEIRRIGFTGSIRTGLAIQKAAAETCVKHVSLELGGKNPLIIFPDADLDAAVNGAIAGMNFAWAGQSCGSTSRILVHESLYGRVIEMLEAKIKAIKVGDAMDPTSQMGPLNSEVHYNRVKTLVAKGKTESRLVTGGDRPAGAQFARGYWMEPTLFADVELGQTLCQEELFGPVMSVQTWSTPEEMLRIANGTQYGLTAAIYTQDITQALKAAKAMQAGVVTINNVRMHHVGAPFGGHKNSGIGGEECLEELLSYTQVKALHISL